MGGYDRNAWVVIAEIRTLCVGISTALLFYSTYGVKNGTPIEANLKGFPEDVDIDFPIIGGSHQADVGGNLYCDAHIENGKFLVPEPDSRMTSTSYEPFVMIYAVRG